MSEEGQWAIVELMGHVKYAGKVSEVEMFGTKMGRVDIPGPDGEISGSVVFGAGSIYRVRFCTEEVARAAASLNPDPIQPWEAPRQLPGHVVDEGAAELSVVGMTDDGCPF